MTIKKIAVKQLRCEFCCGDTDDGIVAIEFRRGAPGSPANCDRVAVIYACPECFHDFRSQILELEENRQTES